MLKKIEKLEDILNSALEKLGKILVRLWLKVIPDPALKKVVALKAACSAYLLLAQSKLRSKIELVAGLIREKKKNASEAPSLKLQTIDRVNAFKLFLLRTPLRSRAGQISGWLGKFLDKTAAIPKTQALIATGAMTMIFFGTYSVYVSSQNIYMQEWGARAPASADQYLDRPEWKKYPARTLKVFNVRIPVYVESVRAVRSVTVDFTVRTDTRFAKQFLEEYEYKLKDYFFMTTEPVISDFAIQEEGKDVIKDKIQDELNIFLEEERVEGQVLDVDIIFIIAS